MKEGIGMLSLQNNNLEEKSVKKIVIGGVALAVALPVIAGAYAVYVWKTVRNDKNQKDAIEE